MLCVEPQRGCDRLDGYAGVLISSRISVLVATLLGLRATFHSQWRIGIRCVKDFTPAGPAGVVKNPLQHTSGVHSSLTFFRG